jgi:hypothetical protein
MPDVDAAWLAGLFDGEGSIVYPRKDAATPGVRITITNSCYPLLEQVLAVAGVGKVIHHRDAGHIRPTHAETWYWACYSANARDLLAQMLPWLIVKRRKAEEAVAKVA